MENRMINCPICHCVLKKQAELTDDHRYCIQCPRCGDFNISQIVVNGEFSTQGDNTKYGERWKISSAIRTQFENGDKPEITTGSLEIILDTIYFPTDPFEIIDLILLFVMSKNPSLGGEFRLTEYDFPAVKLQSLKQYEFLFKKAEELKYIENTDGHYSYQLGLEGWKRVNELKKTNIDSNVGFVAMWFDDQLNEAWTDGIKKAIEEAGYHAIRLDFEEHNEKICDKIIAEIKRAKFVVADFTGQRRNVYFEAGFALGLGIPVIWTCRKDSKDKLHFDTRQYNYIEWSSVEELREKLNNRIRATIKE